MDLETFFLIFRNLSLKKPEDSIYPNPGVDIQEYNKSVAPLKLFPKLMKRRRKLNPEKVRSSGSERREGSRKGSFIVDVDFPMLTDFVIELPKLPKP